MVVKTQIDEIAKALSVLPAEKIAAVQDYVEFLRTRYGHQSVDESDEWTEEDLHDFAAASAEYGEKVVPWEDANMSPRDNSQPDATK